MTNPIHGGRDSTTPATPFGARADDRERYAATVTNLGLRLFQEALAVVRLPAARAIPAWGHHGLLSSVTRTPHELSIVCDWSSVPDDVVRVGPWRAFMVEGTLDFGVVGVLARLTAILAAAGVPLLAVSTHDTDWILVRSDRADDARAAFEGAGVPVSSPGH